MVCGLLQKVEALSHLIPIINKNKLIGMRAIVVNIITMLPRFILLRNGTKTPIGTADTREEAEEKAKARIPYNGSFKPIGIYELVAIGEVGREIVVSPYQGEG